MEASEPVQVAGWGRPDAKILVVAEAPAKQEVRLGAPLVGPSGHVWETWIRSVGLIREMFRIENLYEYQAPKSKIEYLSWDRAELKGILEPWIAYLHTRIAQLWDPWLIVPMGNYALYALTGKGKVAWHQRDGAHARSGILAWRGSILSYTDLKGREIKVIPTPHPTATFEQPELERACRHDWAKIADEVKDRGLHLPRREHIITPSLNDIRDFHEEARQHGGPLTIDIENPKVKKSIEILGEDGEPLRYKTGKHKGHIKKKKVKGDPEVVLVGFCFDPSFSMTISTERSYWKSDSGLQGAWQWIANLCALPNAKNFHNGLYDTFHLAEYGIPLTNWLWDTLYMHHCLRPADTHKLDYCASVDLREVFWKHEAKDPESASQYSTNWQAFATYNGKDVCVSGELRPLYQERLLKTMRGNDDGLTFYLDHYAAEYGALLSLMLTGIRADRELMQQRFATLMRECSEIRAHLIGAVGYDLYAKKEISPIKLRKFLYEDLGLPRQYKKRKKGERTETADEVTVKGLMHKYPEKLGETGPFILSHRKKRKESESYNDVKLLDADDHMRFSLSPNTEAGRLSSSENPRGTGSNSQNINRKVRDIYIAEEGCVLVEIDLVTAESRVCDILTYMITGMRKYYDRATTLPGVRDQHTETAMAIFHCSKEEVTFERRYMGKKTNHAAWRDMQEVTMAEQIIKETGDVYTPAECRTFLDNYRNENVEMLEYFRWVRGLMLQQHYENGQHVHYLEGTWGYRLYFDEWEMTHPRKDYKEECYRRGYSFFPQEEVGVLMRRWGLRTLSRLIKECNDEPKLHIEGHDSLLFSTPPELAWYLTQQTVASLEQERDYWGVKMSIPCSVKVGRTFKGEKEWKKIPTGEEFEEVVYAL